MTSNKLLKSALWYEKQGFSVIPLIPGQKKPMCKWEQYQSVRASREQIVNWWTLVPDANIGIVTGKVSNLAVVDQDKYKKNYNQQEVDKYFPDSIVTPVATTPRGGSHLYFAYPTDLDLTVDTGTVPSVDFRGEGGYIVAPPSSNGNGRAYEWLKDLSIANTSLSTLPEAYKEVLKNKINISTINSDYRLYKHGDEGGNPQILNNCENIDASASLDNLKKCRQMSSDCRHLSSNGDFCRHCRLLSTLSSNVVMFREGRRDNDLFHIANYLVKSGIDRPSLYQTMYVLAMSCTPPFDVDELDEKIKSAIQRAAKRDMNLMQEVREWCLASNGIFMSTQVAGALKLSSREDLKNLSKCLERAVKEGVIVKHGNKTGTYRTVDRDEELIDWLNADVTPIDVRFPLSVHHYVNVHKGNVVVIAGESNAGKTAFCLNVARLNRNNFKINYLSSEMNDGTELRIRLNEFDEPLENWRDIKFQFRTDNFPDKIDPEGFNIIDYLDEGSDAEAYKMGMRIRMIADRLTTGIAVIAIQKAPGKDLGFGGAGTLNRARLYLNIQPGLLTIRKGKIWAIKDLNPNGMSVKFKLAAGSKFHKDGDWA